MNAVPLEALVLDRLLGEPPSRVHPVVWMGRYCARAGARLSGVRGATAQTFAGGAAVAAGCVMVGVAVVGLDRWLGHLPNRLRPTLEAAVLSTLLSMRMLEREVLAVEGALRTEAGDLAAARRAVARLVSRDVTHLDGAQVRQAALESLAENTSDSIVAPLWWYAVAGLPGAAVYRFVNTTDAMWGYRTPAWEWRGKAAARMDDIANWVPARLTALLLCAGPDLRSLAGAAAATPSPNAGWPIAALALRLGIQLSKPGVYVMHPPGRAPQESDVIAAVSAVRAVAAIAATACAVLTDRERR